MTNNREQQIIQAAGNPTPANEMEVNAEKNSFEKEFIELKNKISTLQIQVQNLEGVVFAPEKIYIPLKNAENLEYFDFPMAPEKIKSKNFSLKIGSKLHEDFFKYSEKYGINKADIVESYIYHLVNKLKNKSLENDETKR
jgi:hypothetical protein